LSTFFSKLSKGKRFEKLRRRRRGAFLEKTRNPAYDKLNKRNAIEEIREAPMILVNDD